MLEGFKDITTFPSGPLSSYSRFATRLLSIGPSMQRMTLPVSVRSISCRSRRGTLNSLVCLYVWTTPVMHLTSKMTERMNVGIDIQIPYL
jgi:hypothetical protein